MRRKLLSILTAGLMALGVFVGVGVVNPPAAEASATSCSFFGTGLRGVIRNGQFCGSVNGWGTYINSVSGSFGSSIPIRDGVCNPSLRLQVFDRWGTLITTRYGRQAIGCSWGSWNYPPSFSVQWDFPQARYGRAEVALLDSGREVTRVRMSLH